MDQSTHAWLAIEAYKKIKNFAETDKGKSKKASGLEKLLGQYLNNVVISAWLPDLLIKDMTYGHVFKNSNYLDSQIERFIVRKDALKEHIHPKSSMYKLAIKYVPDNWWEKPYRVKENGGHLPARISTLCQMIRDMLKMGDSEVVDITGIKSTGSENIDKDMFYSPKNIATLLWMLTHYIADAHMPFHCDNRAIASTTKQTTHTAIEKKWGEEVPDIFRSENIYAATKDDIVKTVISDKSKFKGITYEDDIYGLKNNGDPWKEAVYICRNSFAVSFCIVPPEIAEVDNQTKKITLDNILTGDYCGEERFWEISRAIMKDTIDAIAMFWLDSWNEFVNTN